MIVPGRRAAKGVGEEFGGSGYVVTPRGSAVP